MDLRSLPLLLRCYLWAIYAACPALLVGQVALYGGPGLTWRGPLIPLHYLAAFVILTCVAERTQLQVSGGLSQSLSTTVHLTIVLLFPAPYPLVISFLAAVLAQATRGSKPAYKRVFNICHPALTVGVTSWLAGLVMAPAAVLQPDRILASSPALALVMGLYYALDVGILVPVFALLNGQSPWTEWRQTYRPILLPELAACSIGILAAVAWDSHPALLVLFVLPVVALRAAYRAIAQARQHAAALRRRSEQLEAVVAAGQQMQLQQSPAQLLQPVLAAARAITGAATAAAYVCDPKEPTLLRRVVVMPELTPGPVLDAPFSLLTSDLTGMHGAEQSDGVLRVPLHREGSGLIGLLLLADVAAGFNDADRDALVILATQGAIALENARLLADKQTACLEAEAAVRVRDDFLTAASHDLRTPLTVISGYLDLLRMRATSGTAIDQEWLAACLRSVSDSTRRMHSTIEEITDASQLQMGETLALQLEPVDVGEIVKSTAHTVTMANRKAKAPPILVDAIDGAIIAGDRARLERVMQNIIGNAVKYSVQGTEVYVSVEQAGPSVRVTVRDGGVGIPSDELPYIFRHFYRASTSIGIKGTGIGLSGAKTIVEQHNGRLRVESQVGQGTTVTISLPCASTPALAIDDGVADDWMATKEAHSRASLSISICTGKG